MSEPSPAEAEDSLMGAANSAKGYSSDDPTGVFWEPKQSGGGTLVKKEK